MARSRPASFFSEILRPSGIYETASSCLMQALKSLAHPNDSIADADVHQGSATSARMLQTDSTTATTAIHPDSSIRDHAQVSSVHIRTRYGLTDAQVQEMTEDAHKAIAFADRDFRLPSVISLKLSATNGISDKPSYDYSIGRITAPYRFGFQRDGRFISKSRRHARDAFNHEFGHLIFDHNMGFRSEWLRRYHQRYAEAMGNGPYFRRLDEAYVRAYLQSYDELFADIFAVAISGNPRAMASAEYFTLIDRPLNGFKAPRQDILRSRDFLHKTDVDTWNETEVHIRLAPTRSAFIDDPYVANLLLNDPQRLVRLAFEAIQIELNRLFGPDIATLSNTTVPELNRRMIAVMKAVLKADQGR